MTTREAMLKVLQFLYDVEVYLDPKTEKAIRTLEDDLVGTKRARWVCKPCQQKYWRLGDLQHAVKMVVNNCESPCCVCGFLGDSASFDLTSEAGLWLLRKEIKELK